MNEKTVIITNIIILIVFCVGAIVGYCYNVSRHKAAINELKEINKQLEIENKFIAGRLENSKDRINNSIRRLDSNLELITEINDIITEIERTITEIENAIK